MPLYIYQFERTILPKSLCNSSLFRCRDIPVVTVSMLVSADPDIAIRNSPLTVIVTYDMVFVASVDRRRVFSVLFLASSSVYMTRPTRY